MDTKTVWYIGGEDVRMRIPLLRKLREKCFDVAAVGSEEGTPFKAQEIPYYKYSLNRGLNPVSDFYSRQQLYSLFREFQPDIVHAFDTKPLMIVPFAARRAQIKGCVRTVAGMGNVFSSSSLLWRALRPVYSLRTVTSIKIDRRHGISES